MCPEIEGGDSGIQHNFLQDGKLARRALSHLLVVDCVILIFSFFAFFVFDLETGLTLDDAFFVFPGASNEYKDAISVGIEESYVDLIVYQLTVLLICFLWKTLWNEEEVE